MVKYDMISSILKGGSEPQRLCGRCGRSKEGNGAAQRSEEENT